MRRMEWGGSREMPQRMGQGNQNRTDDSGGRVCKAAVTGDGIRLASLNIWTGREGVMQTALWGIYMGGVWAWDSYRR